MIRLLLYILIPLALLVPSTMLQAQSRSDLSGNTYLWKGHELSKLAPDSSLLLSWQNPSGGKITWTDPSDPFRILVYSSQTRQLTWLNNKLTEIHPPVFLSASGIIEPTGICQAKDGGIWVIDAGTSMLIKTDNRLKKQIEVPVRIPPGPVAGNWLPMTEYKEFLAILIPGDKLWIADLYGQILKKIPTTATMLQVSPAGIILQSDSKTELYDTEYGQIKSLIKNPGNLPPDRK